MAGFKVVYALTRSHNTRLSEAGEEEGDSTRTTNPRVEEALARRAALFCVFYAPGRCQLGVWSVDICTGQCVVGGHPSRASFDPQAEKESHPRRGHTCSLDDDLVSRSLGRFCCRKERLDNGSEEEGGLTRTRGIICCCFTR